MFQTNSRAATCPSSWLSVCFPLQPSESNCDRVEEEKTEKKRGSGEAEAPGGAPLHHHLIMPHLTQHYRCIMGSEGGGRGDAELHEYLIKHETTKRRSSRDEEVINIPSGRHADPARRNSSLSSPLSVRAARSPLALFRPKSTKVCGVKRPRKSRKTTEEERVRSTL